jgi:hypothetical protein
MYRQNVCKRPNTSNNTGFDTAASTYPTPHTILQYTDERPRNIDFIGANQKAIFNPEAAWQRWWQLFIMLLTIFCTCYGKVKCLCVCACSSNDRERDRLFVWQPVACATCACMVVRVCSSLELIYDADQCGGVSLFYTDVFKVPVVISFDVESEFAMTVFDIVADCFYITDIVISFRTAYRDIWGDLVVDGKRKAMTRTHTHTHTLPGTLTHACMSLMSCTNTTTFAHILTYIISPPHHHAEIACNYLKTWFVIDIAASLPLTW